MWKSLRSYACKIDSAEMHPHTLLHLPLARKWLLREVRGNTRLFCDITRIGCARLRKNWWYCRQWLWDLIRQYKTLAIIKIVWRYNYGGFISGFRSREGKHVVANFKGEANTNPSGGNPHITYREGQFPRGASQSQGGQKHPLAPLK